jgi:hypothetical protein
MVIGSVRSAFPTVRRFVPEPPRIHQNIPVAATGFKALTSHQNLLAALKACHCTHGHKRPV